MTESKFTPGPWRFARGKLPRIMTSDSVCIAGVHKIGRLTNSYDEAVLVANGTLLAAAPELFKLLTAAALALRSYQYGNAATDLAKEVADAADELLGRAAPE